MMQEGYAGGETGIRTPDRLLTYTRFPGVRLKPLIHLSSKFASIANSRLTAPLPLTDARLPHEAPRQTRSRTESHSAISQAARLRTAYDDGPALPAYRSERPPQLRSPCIKGLRAACLKIGQKMGMT